MSALALPRMLRSKAVQALARLTTAGAASLFLLLLWAGWVLSARPVSVTIDGIHETVRTHRHTVGDLLLDVGILIQPNDRVTPALSNTISRDMRITVERARPYRILADGRETLVTSWGATVADVLADAAVPFERHDRILIGDQQVAPTDSLPAPDVSVAPQTYDQGFGWARLSTEPRLLRLHRAIPITVDDGTLPYIIRTTATTV